MKYLRRPAGVKPGDNRKERRPASQYHPVREDGVTAKCGGAVAGECGFKLLDLERPPLRSLTCHNCLTGRTVIT